jgi:predicted component of type VI protein secretion system
MRTLTLDTVLEYLKSGKPVPQICATCMVLIKKFLVFTIRLCVLPDPNIAAVVIDALQGWIIIAAGLIIALELIIIHNFSMS